MEHYSGGGWSGIPAILGYNDDGTSVNHDHLFLEEQLQQQQEQFHQLQQQQVYQLQQLQQRQQNLQKPQQPQQQLQQHLHQSLASHFHILHMVESLAEAIEAGSRDQQFDSLVNDLTNQFEKCQQLLNSISSSIHSKTLTVEMQMKNLEESEHILNQRSDLIAKFKKSVEDVMNSAR